MVISLKKLKIPLIGVFELIIAIVTLLIIIESKTALPVMGGYLHANDKPEQEQVQSVYKADETGNNANETVYNANNTRYNTDEASDNSERFQRPSSQPTYRLKYTAKDFINTAEQPPYMQIIFRTPEDIIHAYYALLKDASNMAGYHGGCGTVGWSEIPYPYAYELLSNETRQKMSLEKFEESFAGIGQITLLKLVSPYRTPNTPANIKYHMVEIEVISGPPYKGESDNKPQPGYFAYYYGIITTEETPSSGWKIKSVDYFPEDFLCHPMHHWDYMAEALVDIVYKNWYGLVDEIEKIEMDDSLLHVYATGNGNKYRFDFVRLTNGDDVLLHEYIQQNGKWKEVNLLKEEHQRYKFSILSIFAYPPAHPA